MESGTSGEKAGFDAVDIKSCHGYLLAELYLPMTVRGSMAETMRNRTRLLKNGIKAAKVWEDENFQVTCRLGDL